MFWHGGGFTQGNAGQFFHQAQYFTKRGMVVARPEYRIRDLDGSLPRKRIHPNRLKIQDDKYAKKTDWDEQPRFRQYTEENKIKLIPFKHYEKKR